MTNPQYKPNDTMPIQVEFGDLADRYKWALYDLMSQSGGSMSNPRMVEISARVEEYTLAKVFNVGGFTFAPHALLRVFGAFGVRAKDIHLIVPGGRLPFKAVLPTARQQTHYLYAGLPVSYGASRPDIKMLIDTVKDLDDVTRAARMWDALETAALLFDPHYAGYAHHHGWTVDNG